ncbi:MAG: MFS transporter [Clostridia bacterium]
MEHSSDIPQKRTNPLRYAIGMFGTSIPINMFKTYAAVFYVITLGLNTKSFALVLFIYTFVDAIDNPVYGILSDRTRTRWGRRRPWLVIGTPLLILFFVLFFSPPAFASEQAMFVYVLLMYILTGTLDSLINANYGALFPELFRDDVTRAKTNGMRQAFQLMAMIISIALTPIVTGKLGYTNTAIVYGLLALAVILYTTFGCHENKNYINTEKPALWSSLKALFVNPKFWIFGLTNAFYSAALALVMQAVPFFVLYALKLDNSNSAFLLGTVIMVAIVSMIFWVWMVKRVTLIPAWRTALIVLSIGFVPLYFMTSLLGAILICSIIGFGVAGVIATMDLIAAKIMDEDARKYGIQREGIYISAMGFMNRLSGLFISLGYLLVNLVYGFESGDNPGLNPDGASRFLMIVFPFMAMVVSCVFSWFMHFRNGKTRPGPAEPEIKEA